MEMQLRVQNLHYIKEMKKKINSTSDESGLVSFTDIEAGLYTLKEKAAPNGYDISEAEVEVIVSNEGTVTFKKNDAVKNRQI